jgi:hypothetical protein
MMMTPRRAWTPSRRVGTGVFQVQLTELGRPAGPGLPLRLPGGLRAAMEATDQALAFIFLKSNSFTTAKNPRSPFAKRLPSRLRRRVRVELQVESYRIGGPGVTA